MRRPFDHRRAFPAASLPVLTLLLVGGCGAEAPPDGAADRPAPPGGAAAVSEDLPTCDPDDGGLVLPGGFCALVVAEDLGNPRHFAISARDDLFVGLGGDCGGEGGLIALRDEDGDGRMDRRELLYDEKSGTGVALREGWLYFGADDEIVRWPLEEGQLRPQVEAVTVARDLPVARCHRAKTLAFGPEGDLFVNFGSASNVCGEASAEGPARNPDPCPELDERAGIWRFDPMATDQTPDDGVRFATGLRNTVALVFRPQDDLLYGVPHGRDRLDRLWPDLFTPEDNAEKPSEKFVRIREGGNYGWPYCLHDPDLGRLVLSPEYGGDGREVGRCEAMDEPLVAFPAHWAPVGLHFYRGSHFPEEYRGGAFIAFHGSWNRAPLPQDGYRIVFLPFEGGEPSEEWRTFAGGFLGEGSGPADAEHRPVGVAEGPDGTLYVSDDKGGTIWRILHTGE